MARLLYQGHGSFRICSNDGYVIYVDPYTDGGYDLPADLVLVTHEHGDHNQLQLVTKKADTEIVTSAKALSGGTHNSFTFNGIGIEAVTASNKNHDPRECVGYIITVDGKSVYAAGDTSKTEQMSEFASLKLDYALLPCDGVYNMNPEEAAECAAIIGAGHNIPIHMLPGAMFDLQIAEAWNAPNKLVVKPGEEISL